MSGEDGYSALVRAFGDLRVPPPVPSSERTSHVTPRGPTLDGGLDEEPTLDLASSSSTPLWYLPNAKEPVCAAAAAAGGYEASRRARVDPATRSRRSARFRGSAGGANGAGGLRHASRAAGYAGEVGGSRQPRPLRRVEPIVEGWREHPPVAGAGGHIARVKVRGGDRARAASTGDPLAGWSRRVLARVAGGSRL